MLTQKIPRKRVRTISGVSILSVMTKPLPCPGRCIYCPGGYDKPIPTPKSYVPKSIVVQRALRNDYDSRKQIDTRLKALENNGHNSEKNEIVVMGGTFLSASNQYKYEFIKGIYDGLNGSMSSNLEQAKKINETTKHRCVGMCIETRPDWCGQNQINQMLEFGTTRVEMGVQIPDDKIYEITKRGHTVKDVIEATKLLKDSGFKVYYHYMPNLPGSNIQKDIQYFKELFSNPDFKPDGLKIYPCVVVKGTELEEWMNKGEYMPYTDDEVINLLVDIKQKVPRYARIQRIMRDIPAEYIVGGTKYSHLRDAAKAKLKEIGAKCECIRCREVGYAVLKDKIPQNIKMNRIDYDASGGKEIFLSFDDMEHDSIIALLRLRIPSEPFRPEIQDATIVRELHVFGPAAGIQEKSWGMHFQHKGFGRKLIQEAERITRELGYKKIVIISGVGVRRYYIDKLGYKQDGFYVSKLV